MKRRALDLLVAALAGLCALVAVGILVGLVAVIAQRGAPALNWTFFTEQIRLVGTADGIFWNLVGTVILLVSACAACTPLAVGVGTGRACVAATRNGCARCRAASARRSSNPRYARLRCGTK